MLLEDVESFNGPSFSLGNRLRRSVWNAVYALAFRPSPRPLHRWRAWLLRRFGATLGEHVHIYPKAVVWAPWNLRCGNRVGVADGVTLYSMDRIDIGDDCVVSQGSYLCCGSHDIRSPTFQLITAPISLSANVWVCANSFVCPGVTVAPRVVIGAGSVVTRSLDRAGGVYAGNPVAYLKQRDEASTRTGSGAR